MAHDLYRWLQRIKAVEREHAVARLATDRLLAAAEQDPAILQRDLRPRDIRQAAERLDGTYVIRLFAEFETGLRLFWSSARANDPPARTRDLIDGIAAMRRIPHDQIANAHTVREYRNVLVHKREGVVEPVQIATVRGYLCRYFSFLPPIW